MASELEGVPRTVVIPGAGTSSLAFEVPAGVEFYVESVVASIDASGGGAVNPKLTVREQAGEVIATQTQGSQIPAGDTGTATWALRLSGDTAAAAAAAALPWCYAQHAPYAAADFNGGASPDPLAFKFFAGNDATAYSFNKTGVPDANSGLVQILRSGFYQLRFSVAPSSLTTNANPGYNWDLAVQVRGHDAGGSYYFGGDFAPSSVYYSGAAYGEYLTARHNQGGPNPTALQGAGQAQAPEMTVLLDLDDSVVTWPVEVYARLNHALNDADVAAAQYSLYIVRFGDANAAGPTG